MHNLTVTLGILIITSLIAGCIPRHTVVAPGAQGIVVDAETEQPIVGAKIESIEVTTDGHFTLPAQKEWGMTFPFVGGCYRVDRMFTVSAPGYQSRHCICSTVTPNPTCDKLVIPLEKEIGANTLKITPLNLEDGDPVGDNASCSPLSANSPWGKKHIQQLEEAARNGSADAFYELGNIYINGDETAQDIDLGRYCMRRAVEEGNHDAANFFFDRALEGNQEAQLFVGDMLMIGLGTNQDISAAIDWYKQAALQGNTRAMLRLAELYADDEVVPTDKEEALRWYRYAAETGSAEAQFKFAEAYRYGELGEINMKQAIFWWIKAADAGSDKAQDMLMTTLNADNFSEQLKQPIREWLKK